MYRFYSWYKKKSIYVKILFYILVLGFLILTLFLSSYLIGAFFQGIQSDGANYSKLYWGLISDVGRPVTILFYLFILFIFSFSFFKNYRNSVSQTDERGVHYLSDNTYGSSRWLKEDEIKRSYNISNIRNTFETVYGKLESGKVVTFKKSDRAEGNRNVLMIATMGSGKSFGYVRTELIQAALRGDSVVVTDPSAELYTDLSSFFRDLGFDVKCLNLDDPNYSDFWNCLEEVIDPETERIDALRLNEFASVFMKNSAPLATSKAEDPFFVPSAEILLKAIIGYTAWEKEKEILDSYTDLYLKISNLYPYEEKNDEFLYRIKNEHIGFPELRRYILLKAEKNGFNLDEIKTILREIKAYSPKKQLTISSVYDNLKHHFDDMLIGFNLIPNHNPAKDPWLTFNVSKKEDVKAQIVQGLEMRFSLFDDKRLRETLSHSGIHIKDTNMKKSAYFIILSDKNISTKPIASLFFSFLFKDAQDNWDKNYQISKEKGEKNPCLNIVTMLDEFYSIGVIGGSPDAFGTIMSNSRKRHIYISIITQVYSQLEALYGKNIRDIIQAGCDTLLYLGGNDPETCKFISEFVSGEGTILSEMHREPMGIINRGIYLDTNMRQDKRFILTMKEANMFKDEILVSKRGELPLKLKPFPWIEHPMYIDGKIKPVSIYTSIESQRDKLNKLEKTQIPNASLYIMERIENIESNNPKFNERKKPALESKVKESDAINALVKKKKTNSPIG